MLNDLLRRAAAGRRVSGDGNDSYTVLLIHSDTTDGSTTFTDSGAGANCPHGITPSGDVHHESDQAKFGNTSIYFDGTGDYLSAGDSDDWDLGTGDWTIDFWIRIVSNQGNAARVIDSFNLSTRDGWAVLFYSTTNKLSIYSGNVGGGSFDLVQDTALSLDMWTHMAFEAYDNTLTIYKGGISDGSLDVTGYDFMDSSNGCKIGANESAGYLLKNAYLDEIRLSKGIARFQGNFTPPTGPYS